MPLKSIRLRANAEALLALSREYSDRHRAGEMPVVDELEQLEAKLKPLAEEISEDVDDLVPDEPTSRPNPTRRTKKAKPAITPVPTES